VIDPTGAGDSFAGGFMGTVARAGSVDSETLRRAVIFGSVMASFCVEKFSLDRFRDLSQDEVEERFENFRELTRF
jgi:sugar/nucleoside kinase (ribokinase family)